MPDRGGDHNRQRSGLGLGLATLLCGLLTVLLPALAGPARAAYPHLNLSLELPATELEYGQTASIDCRLWLETDGRRSRVNGGRLVVSLISLETKAVLATFTDIPDGKTDVFSLSWRANAPGRVKVAAIFQGKGLGLVRRSEIITVISGSTPEKAIKKEEQPAIKQPDNSHHLTSSVKYEMELRLVQTRFDFGQVMPIDCRLWQSWDRGRGRVSGGRLVVTLYSLDSQRILATFTDTPDGKTDLFGLTWRADTPGRIKISALYQRDGRNLLSRSEIITVGPDPTADKAEVDPRAGASSGPVIKPAPKELPKPKPLRGTDGRLLTRVTIRALPDEKPGSPARTGPVKPVRKTVSRKIRTGVRLDAQATAKKGQWRLSVQVLTTSGKIVGDGEILIIAAKGKLDPGQGGQALLTAAAGRQSVLWTQPPGKAKTSIEASFFGGQGPEGEYAPSSAVIELP